MIVLGLPASPSCVSFCHHNAATPAQLVQAYQEINALERSRVGELHFASYQEFAPWLAIAGAAIVAGELILSATTLRTYP